MPRYGSDGAINYFSNPFHVYSEKDKVPAVPPKWLGYADCHTEYCLKADSTIKGNHRKGGGFIKETWSCARFTVKLTSDHFMEKYIDLVFARVKITK